VSSRTWIVDMASPSPAGLLGADPHIVVTLSGRRHDERPAQGDVR
jgi:hypothetical protein